MAQPITGDCKQKWRGMQIGFGADNVGVSHVSRKPWQPRMKVDSFVVPLSQSMNGEGMAQIVGACTGSASRRLQSRFPEQTVDRVACGFVRQRFMVRAHKQSVIRTTRRIRSTSREVVIQLFRQ